MPGHPLLTALLLAADGASDTGGKDAGESASAWDPGGFLFWLVLVLLAVAVLAGALVATGRRGRGTAEADPGPARPRPRPVRHVEPVDGWELAVLTFDGPHGAEQAYANAGSGGAAGWSRDLAFAECHHYGRVLLRGTVGGHYVDTEDLAAAEGDSPLLTELHADVPPGFSALVSYAPHDEVDELTRAFAAAPHELHRHRARADEIHALAVAVAGAPAATDSSQTGDARPGPRS